MKSFSLGRIDTSTRLCCLIGDPVKHSLSPRMHNMAFQELCLNYIYLAFEVKKIHLESVINGFKSLGISGFNVTIPYKIDVIKYLDDLDKSASDVGAVNTVVSRDGNFIGFNTDVQGVIFALEKSGVTSIKGLSVIIGAGGAARAVVTALVEMGCEEMIILNRTEQKGVALANEVENRYNINCIGLKFNLKNLKLVIEDANLIINATSLGMHPEQDRTPIPKEIIPFGATIFDIVYTPLKTKLLRDAEERGAKVIPGLYMLIGQGASSFKLWTRRDFPIEKIREILITTLSEGR